MRTSYNGRAAIAREEGCVCSAYRDTVGVWTIGIGHTTAAGPPTVSAGLRLSLRECFALFAKDLAKYEKRVDAAVKVPLRQYEYDALVSFDYNTGAIGRASFVKKLNEGDRKGAAEGMLAWSKPPEIIGRRKREQRLFETGAYGDLTGLTVWETRGGPARKMPFPTDMPPSLEPAPVPDVPMPSPRPPAGPTAQHVGPIAGGAAAAGGIAVAASQGVPWGWIIGGLAVAGVAAFAVWFFKFRKATP